MQSMFSLCTSLTSLDLSSFNTEYINGSLGSGMSSMFYGCSKLTSLDLSNFYTSKIKDMSIMFTYCEHLTSLDVSTWNTSNVVIMSQVFDTCSMLPELDLSSWDTSNVTTMQMMFYRCFSLETLNLSNFDMSNVTNMENMFLGCLALRELRLDNCNRETIKKIISGYDPYDSYDPIGLPTGTIDGETRKMYCREENTTGLTLPPGWEFVYTNETVLDVSYDEPTEALLVPESMTQEAEERLTISQATYDPDNENLNI
jgi:surface protein